MRALETESSEETIPGKVNEADKFFILPADPSQERAVFQARDKAGVVVQGPPGTGKSQTIVNILADCIGRGEKALVVCQKQAALEVVTRRMTEEGLGDRFFMVEDARRSRQPIIRALRTQVEAKAAWRTKVSDQSRLDLGRVVERLEDELTCGVEAIHSGLGNSGLTYAEVMDELIQIDRDDEKVVSFFEVRDLFAPMTWVRVREIAARTAPVIQLWAESRISESPWRECRSFSTDEATLNACRRDIESFATTEKARNDLLEAAGKIFDIRDADAFRQWESRFAPWLKSLTPEAVADARRWQDHWLTGKELEEQLNSLKEEARRHKKIASHADFGSLLAESSATQFNQLLKAKRNLRKTGFLPKLNPFYWVARQKVTRFLDANGLPGEEDGLFRQIDWEQQRRKLWRRLRQIETQLGEEKITEDSADPGRIAAVSEDFANRWRALDRIGEAYSQCPEASDFKEAFEPGTPQGIEAFFKSASSSLRYGKLLQASLAALDPFEKWFSESFVSNRRLDCRGQKISRRIVEQMTEHMPLLEPAIRFKSLFEQLDPEEAEVINLLNSFEGGEKEARGMLEREALLGWKAEAEVRHPELNLDSGDFEKKVKRLGKTINELRDANKSRLKRPWRPDLIANATRWMEILRLRGPRAKSIREVLDAGWDYGLFDLRPIWLANPETVSRIFPLREGLFDVVIFDEASQIPVEMAIPTLYRGKRAVISGDRKQLPPTNFFRSDLDEDDDTEFLNSLEDDALREDFLRKQKARREVKDCDDLLQLAEGQLPDCLLSVHYRSRWRHLIAFSNSGFYEGKLSVPVHHMDESIRSHQPIEVRHVAGIYRDQTNPDEAEAVVNYLDELWQDDNPPSAGVVTFNLKQAELIEDLIEQRMIDDEDFRLRHAREQNRGGLDCLFVRNLENVQGDERDIIIFSTTFGPNPKGKFLRNFGPAGQRGGQRRLNVAVTRSKTKMVIFTSMPLNDIAANLPGDGSTPREILKSYLCYGDAVSRGEFETAEAILHRLEGEAKGGYDPAMFAVAEKRVFVREVFDFLKEEGFDPRFDESTDAFHYDIGVPDSATGRFGLAIECDPPVHPELTSAAARELWRPALLKGTIPKVIRLWSREWFENTEAEQERLLKACRFATKKKKKARKAKAKNQ